MPAKDEAIPRREKLQFLTLAGAIGLGVVAIAAWSLQGKRIWEGFVIFASGLLMAGAALVVGVLLGFLFGIPRSPEPEVGAAGTREPPAEQAGEGASSAAAGQDRVGAAEPRRPYRSNTNLEEISDWLTKILVGVGLTTLVAFPDKLRSVAVYLSGALGPSDNSAAFAVAILVYFPVCGFLVSYLWTRLVLPRQFTLADVELLQPVKDRLANLEQVVKALKVGLQRDEYLAELGRIRSKAKGKGYGIGLIYGDVDDLKDRLRGEENSSLLRAEILDALAVCLEEAAGRYQSEGKLHKHDIFFLAVGDPDRIMVVRATSLEIGSQIARDALKSFPNSTRVKEILESRKGLTASFGVLWSEDDRGDPSELHEQALRQLALAKKEGKHCFRFSIFQPRLSQPWECRYFVESIPPLFLPENMALIMPGTRSSSEERDLYLVSKHRHANVKLRMGGGGSNGQTGERTRIKLKVLLASEPDGFELWKEELEHSLPAHTEVWSRIAAYLGVQSLSELAGARNVSEVQQKLQTQPEIKLLEVKKSRTFYRASIAQLEVAAIAIGSKKLATIQFQSNSLHQARDLRDRLLAADLADPKSFTDFLREQLGSDGGSV